MNTVRLAAACVTLLVLTACGAGPYSEAAQDTPPLTARSSASAGAEHARPDNRRALENGLVITVSAPKSFTPTDAAYPRTPRAVAFDLVIENEGTDIYQPSQLSVTATCDGATALQVIDSTQGYTGFVGATDEVPPGQQVRITVAFAVPAARAAIMLIVQPNALDGGQFTVFDGTV